MNTHRLHPEAYRDLEAIWEFIADDNIDAADRVIEQLLRVFGSLARMPNQGRLRRDLTSQALRFFVVREYLVVYGLIHDVVHIVAVVDGRRNPRVIAAILRERPPFSPGDSMEQ